MMFAYFQRQILMSDWGVESQMELSKKTVALVGLGGIGCWSALALAGSGVGKILLIDGDQVDESNLHRQPLYRPIQQGQNKAKASFDFLSQQYPHTIFERFETFLNSENAMEIIQDCDLVLDGTDRRDSRLVIDRACATLGIPWIFAGVHLHQFQTAVFHSKFGKSYEEIFGSAVAPNDFGCETNGVLPPIPALAALHQSLIAIQILGQKKSALDFPLILHSPNQQQINTFDL